jgi:hypothetical protein
MHTLGGGGKRKRQEAGGRCWRQNVLQMCTSGPGSTRLSTASAYFEPKDLFLLTPSMGSALSLPLKGTLLHIDIALEFN